MHPLSILKKPLNPNLVVKELNSITKKLAKVKRLVCAIAFGSAVDGTMTDQSDIDILLIFGCNEDLRDARKIIAKGPRLSSYPVDLIYMLQDEYLRKRKLGGVSMIAHEQGRCLLGEDPK